MYQEFKQLNLPEIDRQILQFWEDQKIFQKSIEERDPSNSFVFYEGPPSANGKPGIHHVMARTVKDLFCRFQTLKGKRVERKGGWDTHGLPVELKVEQELGITKDDIGRSISIEEYNQKCRETVMTYKEMWDDITRKMGYWVDLDNPYITYENDYIESVWALLAKLYEKDMIYKGYTIQPYSPAAGTGLSTHELNMPGAYREVTDTTVVAAFKVKSGEASTFLFDDEEEDVRILAWTTTPWTLPSNTALTVGPKIDYVKIKTKNKYTDEPQTVVLAQKLVDRWFAGKNAPELIAQSEPFKGTKLVGVEYEQLLPGPQPVGGDGFRVIPGNFVTTEDGTGVVHTAPSFGADDMRVGRENGIGALTLVDKTGKFTEEAGEFAGRYVKNYTDDPNYESTDVAIAIRLKKDNKAFHVEKYKHNYPHCWRTDKPVLYYPLDSWFIRASAARERMYELNQQINWKPTSTGEGRFGKWLENLQDWNLSRSRYWGIPLPIWRTEDGSQEICIGSVAQLKTEIEKANAALGLNQTVPEDLHRPYIDKVTLVSADGQAMRRELDLIDVWFDSGSMPYAQWHYPFENQDVFERNFPADFIAEGVDQTRGWFYTLHAIATMVYDSVAFKNVVSNGLVLDKEGVKMSKRLGNVVDPFETLDTYGADATRWYMMANSDPWDNLKFDLGGVDEVRRKLFGTLYNTYNFFALYANIDQFGFKDEQQVAHQDRPEIDRWVISKLNSLIKEVTAQYDDYEPTKACRAVENFVIDNLSNWYVRQSRRRFWKGEMTTDKQSAYETLFTCLTTTAQLMAPVAPFFSDWLYRNLTAPMRESGNAPARLGHDSVHLSILPEVDTDLVDLALEQRMDYAQRISSLTLSLRKKEKIRVRQPLQKILLPVLDEQFATQVDGVKDVVQAEVNVKEIEYLEADAGFLKKRIKPNFKTLGRRLGKQMKAAAQAISTFGQEEIAQIEQTGNYQLNLDGETYDLTKEDFEISTEDIPGWKVATDGKITVALDVTLTPELEAEGMARELVNRIQNLRKDRDFNVTDRIVVTSEQHEAIGPAIQQFGDYIKSEVLADEFQLVDAITEGEQLELPGQVSLKIDIARV